MKQSPLTQILNQIAEQGIPANADYRHVVRARLQQPVEMSTIQSPKGVLFMVTNLVRSRRFAAALVLSTVLLAAVLLITPQGRAWAQSAWIFFTQADADARPVPISVPILATIPANQAEAPLPTFTPQPLANLPFQDTCGSAAYAHCSLAQIQELVDFPVWQIETLPTGWEYVGATGGPQQALVLYRSRAGTLILSQGPARFPDPFTWPVGSSARVETVAIGAETGEYVQGAWAATGLAPASVAWDAAIPERTLRWESGSLRYTLQFKPAKTDEGIEPDQAMLAAWAAALTPVSATASAPAILPNDTLQSVASNAGFSIAQPAWMPERYAFVQAVDIPAQDAVCLYYGYPDSEGSPSLVIIETPRRLELQDILLPPQVHNGVQIDIPVHIETVAVGGALNEQALYASNGLDINTLCGTRDIPSNHALLWQSDDKSLVVSGLLDAYDGRGSLTRLEMRRIAEGLTGVSTIPSGALDPGRLPSVEAVETLAGFEVRAPSRMPTDVRFAYAIYRSADSPAAPNSLAQGSPEVIQVYFASTRDSLGRYHHYLFFQNTAAPNTLEELALGGGEWVSVHGQPAIYSQSCWDDTPSGGEAACTLSLSWFDETGMRFDIQAYLPGTLEKEIFLSIAESMQ